MFEKEKVIKYLKWFLVYFYGERESKTYIRDLVLYFIAIPFSLVGSVIMAHFSEFSFALEVVVMETGFTSSLFSVCVVLFIVAFCFSKIVHSALDSEWFLLIPYIFLAGGIFNSVFIGVSVKLLLCFMGMFFLGIVVLVMLEFDRGNDGN